MNLLVLAVLVLFGSGVLALAVWRLPRLSTAIGTLGAVAGCGMGLVPAVQTLLGGPSAQASLPWGALTGQLVLGLDPLSSFFLVPLLVLALLASIYGREYLLAYKDRKWLGPPAFAFNVLVASMAVVVLARSAVLFLVAWEVMALAAYILVTFDHAEAEVRRAGWTYLVASHAGVACLIAMFLLLDVNAGEWTFKAFATMPAMSPGFSALILVLAMVGFGVKAGFVPLHIWLPEAHAAAPSHVSALMSGVLIKLGLYGILRVMTFLTPAGWWGPTLVVLGLAGALLGISLALYQRDLKRVLAYSSIENMGLITLGLGIAFWGANRGAMAVAALGAAGAMLHVWNHVLMKGLMFLSAGSVLHGAGTKNLERLGGLMKHMPRTGVAMVVGAVAISGLPPLNGFVSEWLLYRGLINGGLALGGGPGIAAFLEVGLLSVVGGLAALCFVRLIGVVFLGEPRSHEAGHAHESSWWMTGPIIVLALGTLTVASFPAQVLTALAGPMRQLFGNPVADQLAAVASSLHPLGQVNAALWAALAMGGVVAAWLLRSKVERVGTWDCGYAAPTARMQYTARSFSEFMSEHLMPSFFQPRIETHAPEQALFPAAGSFDSNSDDPMTRGVYVPFFTRWADRFSHLRFLQQGQLNIYLLYILVVVVVGLGWLTWGTWIEP